MLQTSISLFHNKLFIITGVFGIFVAALLAFEPTFALAIAVILVLSYLSLDIKNPQYFILVFVIYNPFDEFVLRWLPDNIYPIMRYSWEIFFFFLLIGIIFKKKMKKETLPRTPLDYPLVLFLSLCIASLIWNKASFLNGFVEIEKLLRYVSLFYIVMYIKPSEKFIRKLTNLILIIVAIECFVGLFQYAIGDAATEFLRPKDFVIGEYYQGARYYYWVENAVFATLGDKNSFASFLRFFLLIALGLFLSGYMKHKNFLMFIGLSFFTLILTYSRTYFFGSILGILSLGLFVRNRKIIASILVCLLIIFIFITKIGTEFSESYTGNPLMKLSSVLSQEYIDSSMNYGRLYLWRSLPIEILRTSPLLGFGPTWDINDYENIVDIDNPYLFLLGDTYLLMIAFNTGFLGLFCILWIFFQLFGIALKIGKNSVDLFKRGIGLGFMMIIVSTVFANIWLLDLKYRSSSPYFWIYAGFLVSWMVTRNSKFMVTGILKERRC